MNKIINKIFYIETMFKTEFEKILEKYKMNYNCYLVLNLIYNKQNLTVSDVCIYLNIKNSSLTYIVKKLESNNTIEKIQQEEDKRSYILKTTNKGNKLIKMLNDKHDLLLEKTFNNINLNNLDNKLNKIIRNIDKYEL